MAGILYTQEELFALAEDVDPFYDQPDELPMEDVWNAVNDPVNEAALALVWASEEEEALPEWLALYDHQPYAPLHYPLSGLVHKPEPWDDTGSWMCDNRQDVGSEPRRVKCDASSTDTFE